MCVVESLAVVMKYCISSVAPHSVRSVSVFACLGTSVIIAAIAIQNVTAIPVTVPTAAPCNYG